MTSNNRGFIESYLQLGCPKRHCAEGEVASKGFLEQQDTPERLSEHQTWLANSANCVGATAYPAQREIA